MRKIIIIGGMGPQASLELHRRLLNTAAINGAEDNDDFPEILHLSIPVPDFISPGGQQQAGFSRIKQSLSAITFAQNDQVILACNTAHLLLADIEGLAGTQFISLIDMAVDVAVKENVSCVGILASPTTLKAGLYAKPLRDNGITVVEADSGEVSLLENVIREVIANRPSVALAARIQPILERMRQSGAERIILGCTELSVIFSKSCDKTLIDPLNSVCKLLIEV